MTLLKVHDNQQLLAHQFVNIAKSAGMNGKLNSEKKENIYLKGQEMGFCNDEIRILLEDVFPSR